MKSILFLILSWLFAIQANAQPGTSNSELHPFDWEPPGAEPPFYSAKSIQGFSCADDHMHFSHSDLWNRCTSSNGNWSASQRGFSAPPPLALTAVQSEYRKTTSDNTQPTDHAEGLGRDATPSPSSLYLDQLKCRISLSINLTAPNSSLSSNVILPDTSIRFEGETISGLVQLEQTTLEKPEDSNIRGLDSTSLTPAFAVSQPVKYSLHRPINHHDKTTCETLSMKIFARSISSTPTFIIPPDTNRASNINLNRRSNYRRRANPKPPPKTVISKTDDASSIIHEITKQTNYPY